MAEKNLPEDLTDNRKEIDQIDQKLLNLIHERSKLVINAGKIKKKSGDKTFYRPDREASLIKTLQKKNKSSIPAENIKFIFKEILTTKRIIAQKLGVNSKNVALTENISSGMILPFWGIKVEEGEELLISDCEHPGVVAASREFCRRNKLIFKILPIQKIKKLNDENIILEILKNLNSKTKILIISHILWNFGYKIPLKQISIELKKIEKTLIYLLMVLRPLGT